MSDLDVFAGPRWADDRRVRDRFVVEQCDRGIGIEGATRLDSNRGCNAKVVKEWLFRTRLDSFDRRTAIRQISQTTMIIVRRDSEARRRTKQNASSEWVVACRRYRPFSPG